MSKQARDVWAYARESPLKQQQEYARTVYTLPVVVSQQQSLAAGTGFWRTVAAKHGGRRRRWAWILLVN